jgi:hypothetical protein
MGIDEDTRPTILHVRRNFEIGRDAKNRRKETLASFVFIDFQAICKFGSFPTELV